MVINKVTITGWDNVLMLDELREIYSEYPFLEFGILFSGSKEGERRYPPNWVRQHIEKTGMPLSAHFCGRYSREVLESQNYDEIKKLPPCYKRVQLNYSFARNQNWSMPHLELFASENPHIGIILQYNNNNRTTINTYQESFPENIHVLYDASGGHGTEIKTISDPFKNYTGYAGGITNKNAGQKAKAISDHTNQSLVWMDMESGVRTNDIFDNGKVREAAREIAPFVKY